MNADELRLGNYIKQRGNIVEVQSVQFCVTDWKRVNGLIYKSCEPIPLTEEWLLNFGYTKEGSNFWFIGHIVWEYDDGVFICDKNGITLKYVHQLQNLYFALTGKELKLQNTAE